MPAKPHRGIQFRLSTAVMLMLESGLLMAYGVYCIDPASIFGYGILAVTILICSAVLREATYPAEKPQKQDSNTGVNQ